MRATVSCCCTEEDFLRRVNAMLAAGYFVVEGTFWMGPTLEEQPHPAPPCYKLRRIVEMERHAD